MAGEHDAEIVVPAGMVLVPGGRFRMGSDTGYAEEGPAHDASVGTFFMDARPVTNGAYVAFCEGTGRDLPESPRWPDMVDSLRRYPDHPVVNVNARDAEAYAAWCGKRLPTEAEWEYAALGGVPGGPYPWGDVLPNATRAVYAGRHTPVAWRDQLVASDYPRTAPVGSFAPNGYGLYDMAGNVWEWCANWIYQYPWEDLDSRRVGEGWGLQRVMRGGAWSSPARDLRISRRLRVHSGVGSNQSGFRCVQDVPGKKPVVSAPILTMPPAPDPAAFDAQILASPRRQANGVEVCLGCGEDISEDEAARISAMGFTSVEQYVHWGTVENAGEGQFDFSHWDRQVETLERHGLKWVPFLIAGPAYTLPDWFRESAEHRGAVCLEHGLPSRIQSVFDVEFRRHVERYLTAFAEHYRDRGVLESLLLGITGDFGEAIYPVTGTAWPQVIPGPYHTHPGYWCGDPIARENFRVAMLAMYDGDLARLNEAWGVAWSQASEIVMPTLQVPVGLEGFRADEPTPPGQFEAQTPQERRRWLDFIGWYRGGMNDLARFWMQTTRRLFPDHPVYLCTGGDAPPHHGADFGEQCRLAAEVGGGVRITNEDSKYAHNFAITRWVTSAGRQHGAYTGIEPAGGVNEFGVTCRVFNAAVSGAKNLHFYAGNIVHAQATVDAWMANYDAIRIEAPRVEVAYLHPDTSIMLGLVSTNETFRQVMALRDLTDLDFVDDAMVADGVLSQYRVLVMANATVVEAVTLATIDAWLEQGGMLVLMGTAEIQTVEGESWTPADAAMVVRSDLFGEDEVRSANVAAEIGNGLRDAGYRLIDGVLDGVFVSHVDDGLVVLNHEADAVTRTFTQVDGEQSTETTLPGNTITRLAGFGA